MIKLLIIFISFLVNLSLGANSNEKPQTLFSGVTPANANWQTLSSGTVGLEVQTRLSLTSTPTYLCRIVHRFSASSTSFFDFDPLTNVTGSCTPRNPTPTGFKVRLRYSDERNLTTTKVSDWKVVWIAATNKHPGIEKPGSIEAQVELMKQLIEEEPLVVRGLLGSEYFPMERNLPKPKPVQPKNETSTDSGKSKKTKTESKTEPTEPKSSEKGESKTEAKSE